ncbi:amidase domain-containing protein [Clostridium oryzae]|nr:amidase domain-containing protein [Clostridium oryzae]
MLISNIRCIKVYSIEEQAEDTSEIAEAVKDIFKNRNDAIITKDLELIKSIYDLKTKYGTWAFEYERKKLQYIINWEQRQGVKFIEIKPNLVIRRIRKRSDNKYSINLLNSTEYKYIYEDRPEEINTFRIGTHHTLQLMNEGGFLVITKEWYKDPFADSLDADNSKKEAVKQYILSQERRDFSAIPARRMNAMEYAYKYCGAASEEKDGYKYNRKYRNYNYMGGDCANFASQILFEGGKFRKNSAWNYDKSGATGAWVNADRFKNYMLNSGRASLIAYGSYDRVYKASYKLLPGDFVAYEKKGDVTHISTVSSADSRGYSLVTCHNTDRKDVPWDLGWSNRKIRFWLVHVHY